MRVVARREAGFREGQRRLEAGKVRLLREVADGGAGLHEAHGAIRLDQACGDAHQGRLARAVAADEAGALAGRDRQLGAFDQRGSAEGERNVLKGEKRGSGHAGLMAAAALRNNASGPGLQGDRRKAIALTVYRPRLSAPASADSGFRVARGRRCFG
ncbi:hypothetical protein M2440_003584 [Methylorubrum extorquens]|nr:hypothetical protein [Methylorubrum extorquens]